MLKAEHLLREDVYNQLLESKRQKDLTFQQIADKLGKHKLWVSAAINGNTTMDEKEVRSLCEILEIESNIDYFITIMAEPPLKKSEGLSGYSGDPIIHRMYEVVNIYGQAIKDLVYEEFGEGIMSETGLQVNIEKKTKEDGDHVVITLDGKFLPLKK
jgi:cyanate lyase